jgi:predicted O-methyltransferase YrrM
MAYHSPAWAVLEEGVANTTTMGSPPENRLLHGRRLGELCDVLAGYAGALAERLITPRPAYETISWEAALADLEARFGNVAEILEEPALRKVEEGTRRLLADIRPDDSYLPRWAADSLTARLCYLACRLIEPHTVVETGVAYGVSSAYILTALRENGRGTLYSVDLPPLRRKSGRFWGIAVDDDLRGRWRLHRGTSASILPRLLREIPTVDLFVHDSLHTHRNMRREFDTIWPHLREGALLLADDVERNRAFGELEQKAPALWRVVKDREVSPLHGKAAPVAFGIAMK